MTDFRFLHAADIHLDSPLYGLSRYDGLPEDDIRGATRAAFDNLVQRALDEAVDFVVIAGDLFDGEWKDMSTGLYFARAMGRLDQAVIPVFLLAGNHDAESVLTRSVPWPPTLPLYGFAKLVPMITEPFAEIPRMTGELLVSPGRSNGTSTLPAAFVTSKRATRTDRRACRRP